jgi:hypothetical protein
LKALHCSQQTYQTQSSSHDNQSNQSRVREDVGVIDKDIKASTAKTVIVLQSLTVGFPTAFIYLLLLPLMTPLLLPLPVLAHLPLLTVLAHLIATAAMVISEFQMFFERDVTKSVTMAVKAASRDSLEPGSRVSEGLFSVRIQNATE